jgi:hypothetical protein
MSLSFDVALLFVTAGQVFTLGWMLFAAPVGVLVGFWLVTMIKRKLTHRAGVEKARSTRF